MKIISTGRRYTMLRLGVGWSYAEKSGHACLRHEVSWKKINGFWLNTPNNCRWFLFRRTGVKPLRAWKPVDPPGRSATRW